MKVTLADALGTCFGVKDAIKEALDPKFKGNLTVIGQLVHNPQTVQELRENGVEIIDSIDNDIQTPNVMITAHGAAKSVIKKAHEKGFKVYDASCPLVMRAHKVRDKLIDEGYFPVVIGQETHVEVRGIVTDLKECVVIKDESDFHKLLDKPRLGIISQTTNQTTTVYPLVDKIKALKNPDGSPKDVKFIDTICKPTKDRQKAIHKLTDEVEMVIVVGGYNSSNTKKLKKVCDDKGVPAFHVERSSQLKREWFKGINHVGVTAGTSTPSHVIDDVYQAVLKLSEQLIAQKKTKVS